MATVVTHSSVAAANVQAPDDPSYSWLPVGAATRPACLGDGSDTTYLSGNVMGNLLSTLGAFPTAPAGTGLHRWRLGLRMRRTDTIDGGNITLNTATLNLSGTHNYAATFAHPTGWANKYFDWTVANAATLPTGATFNLDTGYGSSFDWARLFFELDYRNVPSFTAAASAGSTRYITTTASSINLDGLPAKSWTVAITGPLNWSTSGTGPFPANGVVSPELPDGTYNVNVTIASAIRGAVAHSAARTVSSVVVNTQDLFTQLVDTNYDGSLAEHFDLACNSVGGYWYCSKSNVIEFGVQPPDVPAWAFTDEPTSDIRYTQLAVSYDSRNLVNDLTAHNKAATGEVAYNYRDATSVATWGTRTDDVDLTVLDAGGALARRTVALVERFKGVQIIPLSATFIASDYPDAAADIELYDLCTVRYLGTDYLALVAGIEHEVIDDLWQTTLQFMKA